MSLPRPPNTVPRICALPVITSGPSPPSTVAATKVNVLPPRMMRSAPGPPRTEPPTKVPAVDDGVVAEPAVDVDRIAVGVDPVDGVVARAAVDRVGAVAGDRGAAREHIVTQAAVHLDSGGEVGREDVGRVVHVAEIEHEVVDVPAGCGRASTTQLASVGDSCVHPGPAVRPAVSVTTYPKNPAGGASRTVTWFTSPWRATRRSTPASSTASVEATAVPAKASNAIAQLAASAEHRRMWRSLCARRPRSPACSELADREAQACDGSEQPWRLSFGSAAGAEHADPTQYRDPTQTAHP